MASTVINWINGIRAKHGLDEITAADLADVSLREPNGLAVLLDVLVLDFDHWRALIGFPEDRAVHTLDKPRITEAEYDERSRAHPLGAGSDGETWQIIDRTTFEVIDSGDLPSAAKDYAGLSAAH